MNTFIGLDIGGTHIHGILMQANGKVIKSIISQTQSDKKLEHISNQLNYSVSKGGWRYRKPHKFIGETYVGDYIVENIISVIESLILKDVTGIGLGIAGVVDKDEKFLFNPNIPKLKGVNLKKIIQNRFRVKVVQENDANCFAIAEHTYGAGNGIKNLVGLIIGTGIGGGIILDNKLYKGTHGFAGEFGHSIINPMGPKCNCGLNGDFESLCSGPAIVKRYYKGGGKIKNAEPEKIFNSREEIAKITIKDTIRFIGIGISHIVNALDIEFVILGGGVSNLDFYAEINEAVKRFSNSAVRENIRIVKNKLGDFSGAIGSAILCSQNLSMWKKNIKLINLIIE